MKVSVSNKNWALNVNVLSEDVVQTIGTIGPNAEFKYALDIKGLKVGTNTVVVGLSSDKIDHVTGEKEVSRSSIFSKLPIKIAIFITRSFALSM